MSSSSIPARQSRKRKVSPTPSTPELSTSQSKKSRVKESAVTGKGKGKSSVKIGRAREWPEYFDSLFKTFKALNTVIAFCSSRKHLALTFSVVRASVEGLLKHPLELAKVAELKVLLPDLILFAYIPSIELRIHADGGAISKKTREASPDFTLKKPKSISSTQLPSEDEEEHVLVLDFVDSPKGHKSANAGFVRSMPPAMTPAATKKLIEKRNNRFTDAVNELLEATRSDEDPVMLVQEAARDYIPVDPSSTTSTIDTKGKNRQSTVPAAHERPTIDTILEEIQKQAWYNNQIVHRRTAEAKEGQTGVLDNPISDTVKQALQQARKIYSLYTHQAESINALAQGKNVIVSTSTASGKSVIYQVPLLTFLESNQDATAMFIYPTKALAQDQKGALEQLLASCPSMENVVVATYDGDTPQEDRRGIRETASVIFTNFDMIHASILPHEDLWRRFLQNLKLVAVDELHYYNGIFGSHVAQVIRRMRRICAAVGNRRVQFVSCSATISKPRQHMENLFGIKGVEEIVEDGAPSGRKDYLVWTPPPIDELDPSLGHKSAMSEATRLMRFLMERGVRVILFCKIRKICEWAMKALRTELTAAGRLDILKRVMAYRGGYSPQDRRKIEQEAFSGHLLGIVATNALELGVDIGVLDAVLMLGFPIGGIASYRQQAGRAGRRARDALAVYIADGFPVDMHYVTNPDDLWEKPTGDLIVDVDSKIILEAHLQCAAHEVPLTSEDEKYFGPLTKEICEKSLTKDADGWYHTHNKYLPYPAKHVTLRGVEEEKYCVVDISKVNSGGNPRLVEEVEVSRALYEIYEGGIFIHQGLTFMIQEVSHDSKLARVVRTDANWITTPRDYTNVDAAQTFRIREIRASPHRAYYGRVELKSIIYGYYKIRNNSIIDTVDMDTPPWERETIGFWLDVPKPTLELLKDTHINPAEAIHAAAHAMMNRFALARDLETECKVAEKEYRATESRRKRPARLIFFEPSGKIAGVAAKAFDHVSDILNDAVNSVLACPCEQGCTACVLGTSCKESNLVSNKPGAAIILQSLAGLPIDADLLVPQEHQGPVAAFETIEVAPVVQTADGVELEKDS
ncbi:P-loop containing nucleoside triphosphate hydrolase protein [Cristinia sonorae]|uniref:P-loop containing nucleoside triphosphate hydrolase protein n=1 Tax=Cristinia sonorae TaxID=1940300 RepID=A0A8K0UYU9_9AGAR|nr:P-loop containing nucleoside triphosphate hydrolase protein [Cristinia sonorae]